MRKNLFGMLFLAGVFACGSAAAQVHRCIDAAGKVAYSDTVCSTSAKRADQVLGRGATEARDDPWARERNLESIRRAGEIKRSTVDSVTRQSQGPAGAVLMDSDPNQRIREQDERNMAKQMAEADAQRRVQEERAERRARSAANARRQGSPGIDKRNLSQCVGAFCYDNKGGSYMKGADNTLQRNDGATCTPVYGSSEYKCR